MGRGDPSDRPPLLFLYICTLGAKETVKDAVCGDLIRLAFEAHALSYYLDNIKYSDLWVYLFTCPVQVPLAE